MSSTSSESGSSSDVDQEEYARLMKILRRRVDRKLTGAAKFLKTVSGLPRSKALKSLKEEIGTAPRGRPAQGSSVGHNPSQGKSVAGRLGLETLRVTCFKKGLLSSGSACRNTLCLFAAAREQNLESELPIPKLYEVRKDRQQQKLSPCPRDAKNHSHIL